MRVLRDFGCYLRKVYIYFSSGDEKVTTKASVGLKLNFEGCLTCKIQNKNQGSILKKSCNVKK